MALHNAYGAIKSVINWSPTFLAYRPKLCLCITGGGESGNTGVSEVVVGGGGQTVLTPEPWAQWLHYTRYSLPLSP